MAATPPLHRSRKASASYSRSECFIDKTMVLCYIERGGKIVNQNGHTGVFCTDVYQLTENGFTQSLEAVCERQVKYIDDDNYEFYYKHFISGNPVSEYEHDIAVYTSFDFTQALRLDENAVSYEQIKQQITDH